MHSETLEAQKERMNAVLNPEEFVGPVKIFDGLFLGDDFSAHDFEFFVKNKVKRAINCSASEISNALEAEGVKYLSFHWGDFDSQVK